MPSARIGVNALYMIPGGVGGTEIYLRSLLAALAELDRVNEYFIFTNRETAPDLVPSQPNFVIVAQPVRASIRPLRILWEQTVLPFAVARHGLDVLLNPGFTAPVFSVCPNVTVFHDMQHKRHPEHFRWFDLPFWRMLLYAAAHRSARLIAVSESTRSDLLRFYNLRPEKVMVVPHGVDRRFAELNRRNSDPPYFLSVSTLHPHKNLENLLRAFAGFRHTHPQFRLVIAGLRGFAASAIERVRAELGLAGFVDLPGWLPRVQLYDLFAGAFAFIYPSTFEGFGMPVLEAIAAGIPTACSNIEPLASIAGSTVLQFDPHDVSAIQRAMVDLASNDALRGTLSKAGPVRAAQFSWETAALKTIEIILREARMTRRGQSEAL